MKKHDCYWAWFKGRDNQDELATWHKIFQRSPSPRLEFCKAKSSLDGCNSMLHDNWLDIPWVIIIRPLCFKPRMVSDKNTWRNIFFTIIFLCSFHKGIIVKRESPCYLPKVLVLGQKLILGKPSNCASNWWSGFPSNTNICVPISRFMPTTQWDLQYLWYTNMSTTTLSKILWTESMRGLKISFVAMLERPIDSGDF